MSNPIGWTDQTWNPVTGCTPISPACDHCYARRMAKRLRGRYGYPDMVSEWSPERGGCMVHRDASFDVTLHEDKLRDPLHWRKPRRVFVVSMGDLFHEDVPRRSVIQVFATMALAPQHTFQVLTKRPTRMQTLLSSGDFWRSVGYAASDRAGTDICAGDQLHPPSNVWLGVTAEDQQRADERIPILLQTPAAVRFVSVEPMLGPVHLEWLKGLASLSPDWAGGTCGGTGHPHPLLDWVICGGETGPGARPMQPEWARSLRDQCHVARVPFWFKGWGQWLAVSQGAQDTRNLLHRTPKGQNLFYRVGKKLAGDLLDGVEWHQTVFPEV